MILPRGSTSLVPSLRFIPTFHRTLEATQAGSRVASNVVMSDLGPYIEIAIRPPGFTAGGAEGAALIDTGATHTVVSSHIMAALGLKPVGRTEIVGPGAPSAMLDLFACEIHFLHGNVPKLVLPRANASPLDGSPFIALLGRDFLTDKLLILDGRAGYYTLAW